MIDAKIYGLCIERLKYQISKAKERTAGGHNGFVLLECYNTGNIDDIIDILELYDIGEKTFDRLWESLGDLAYTVSLLTQETLYFDFTEHWHLGLYLSTGSLSDNSVSCAVCPSDRNEESKNYVMLQT